MEGIEILLARLEWSYCGLAQAAATAEAAVVEAAATCSSGDRSCSNSISNSSRCKFKTRIYK